LFSIWNRIKGPFKKRLHKKNIVNHLFDFVFNKKSFLILFEKKKEFFLQTPFVKIPLGYKLSIQSTIYESGTAFPKKFFWTKISSTRQKFRNNFFNKMLLRIWRRIKNLSFISKTFWDEKKWHVLPWEENWFPKMSWNFLLKEFFEVQTEVIHPFLLENFDSKWQRKKLFLTKKKLRKVLLRLWERMIIIIILQSLRSKAKDFSKSLSSFHIHLSIYFLQELPHVKIKILSILMINDFCPKSENYSGRTFLQKGKFFFELQSTVSPNGPFTVIVLNIRTLPLNKFRRIFGEDLAQNEC